MVECVMRCVWLSFFVCVFPAHVLPLGFLPTSRHHCLTAVPVAAHALHAPPSPLPTNPPAPVARTRRCRHRRRRFRRLRNHRPAAAAAAVSRGEYLQLRAKLCSIDNHRPASPPRRRRSPTGCLKYLLCTNEPPPGSPALPRQRTL